ncbi:hypothetical protein BHE74_00015210 [Ensete ventricosum]|nr:hypothetical protein BHE74_00015210 [Ensete ventricosum]
MEDVVKKMLKLIEADADSFAKRAELYFKRRPELISFVEDAYRAYRALAERYDHISGELHKANHTIATACPEQVQYAMLEEEDDNFPKAITPIDPSKINKPTVEGLMNRRRESDSSIKRKQKNSNVPQINKEKAEVEIDKLQKGILVLQTEKEFIKSSYEIGIAKYWEIEKQIMDMQEKVSCLQDEFGTSAVIKDDEARALMTATALKSCEDAIVNLQEQRKKSLEQAKVESERIEVAKDKLKTLKGDYCQSEMEDAEMSGQNTQMSFTAEKMEDGRYSLDNARLELQSICEKIKTHFEMNPESSVIEIAEKINELVDKVLTLELTVSSQAVQINRLTSENNELDNYLQKLEEEKTNLISDSNALSERLNEAEEELGRVQAIEKIVRDEEINFYENFSEACCSLSGISEKLQSHKSPEDVCLADASTEEEATTFSAIPPRDCQDKEVTEIHDVKKDMEEEIDITKELGHRPEDPSQMEAGSQLKSASDEIEDPKKRNELGKKGLSQADLGIHQSDNEEILFDEKEHAINFQQVVPSGLEGTEKNVLAEYTSILQNYEVTKRRLSEVENKSEEHLQETMALIGELKNVIAMKDEEIQSLKQQLASLKMSSDITADAPSIGDFWDDQQKVESTSNSVMATESSNPQDSQMLEDLSICTTKRDPYDEFTEVRGPLEEGSNADRINEQESISPVEEKLRRDIDALLDRNLEFWLRFSTSFHHIQEFKAKYEDLQAAIDRLKDNKTRGSNDGVTGNQDEEPESAVVATRLRELKTELQVWLEQNALLKGELQSTISSLDDMQGEISTAANTKSETGEAMCTPCQAARFQGEVMNMKQEKNKAAGELQEGLDQVRRLQAEIDLQWSKLRENFEPFPSAKTPDAGLEHSPSRTRVPLRVFLFGAKPKKPSLFARIHPVFQKQSSKLKAGRRLYSHRFLIWSRLLHFFAPKFRCDLAAKSSRPRTARPLTWPNQRDWSKDTRCRTADLTHVRSATPTCRRTPHHQYGRRGGKRGSMVPYGRPGTGKVGNPHLQAHASPPVRQAKHVHLTSSLDGTIKPLDRSGWTEISDTYEQVVFSPFLEMVSTAPLLRTKVSQILMASQNPQVSSVPEEKALDIPSRPAAAADKPAPTAACLENPIPSPGACSAQLEPAIHGNAAAVGSNSVVTSAMEDGPVTDLQKKLRRAERFGTAVMLSEEEKRNSRAER